MQTHYLRPWVTHDSDCFLPLSLQSMCHSQQHPKSTSLVLHRSTSLLRFRMNSQNGLTIAMNRRLLSVKRRLVHQRNDMITLSSCEALLQLCQLVAKYKGANP